ncbi:50S ribosomal protein L1 [Pasteuria penetrans]|uniref:50S ribosomal protein L1 n=1 Tax=Pasteuria penetrans TaxID=86005 RepID=UPI000FBDF4ED|nr:50S ribosomal protein L1 [Pasteuria penetrans]
MARRGKKYRNARAALKEYEGAVHTPMKALSLVKEVAHAQFDETVEAAFRLGVDPRQADQQVRGAVVLPHGTGRTQRVVVIASGDKAKEAQLAGADEVGDEDIIRRIQQGWLDFDVVIATPDMMPRVGQLGRILGPRGLMPNPKTGTVTPQVGRAIEEVKAGKIEYRVDRAGNVHAGVGKVSFDVDQLVDNLQTLAGALVKAKPAACKGIYMRGVTVASTMGPGVPVDLQAVCSGF